MVLTLQVFLSCLGIVGNTTWEVMHGKKALKVEFELMPEYSMTMQQFGRGKVTAIGQDLERFSLLPSQPLLTHYIKQPESVSMINPLQSILK
jgi:hypothetical protein